MPLRTLAQSVFDILGCGIAGPGKRAEGGNIGKIPVAEPPYVVAHRLTLHDGLGGLENVGGQLQAGSKVVGGTGGDIADGGVRPGAEQAGNGLVQRAVAAAADHQINIFALLPGDGGGVSPSQRHVGDDLIARLCKCQQNVSQMPVRPFHPGKWIHDKQHLFHFDNLDYPVVFLFVYYTIPWKMRKSFSLPLVNSG